MPIYKEIMSSSDTGQTRLRSPQPANDGDDQDAGHAPDNDGENINEEHKQSEVPAIETSQAASNPWAPVGWSQDLPPRIEVPVASQQHSAAQPTAQQLLAQTLAAVTSLQSCMATFAATIHTRPPPIPPPQPRHTGAQPTPTLADLLTTPAMTKKRYGL